LHRAQRPPGEDPAEDRSQGDDHGQRDQRVLQQMRHGEVTLALRRLLLEVRGLKLKLRGLELKFRGLLLKVRDAQAVLDLVGNGAQILGLAVCHAVGRNAT
jgi:hypothetical protein